MRAWIAQAFGGTENPYSDEPSVAYAYDDRVQNHKRVEVGDILFIRNRHRLEGVGRISRIETGSGEKSFSRCPDCGSSRVHARKNAQPRYRCQIGHTFSEPRVVRERVDTFRAIYEGDYSAATARIEASELRPFHLRNSQQMAIMPADLAEISRYVARRDRAISDVLTRWLPSSRDGLSDDEADEGPDVSPTGVDERAKILRAIRIRRGQRAFRQDLMVRFDGKCVISGCGVSGVLEAAHIRPYRTPRDNDPSNGLLLRADLHTLFDLHRIVIQPSTLNVVVHPDLEYSEYQQFAGQPLSMPGGCKPNEKALRVRWDEYEQYVYGEGE